MSKDQKNSLDFDYNYMPENYLSKDKPGITILIKHDYYSSDTIHGKQLLTSILNYLQEPNIDISSLYIIDSGVKLLLEDNDLYNNLVKIINKTSSVYICIDSIEAYISSCQNFDNAIFTDMNVIIEQLLFDKPDFIIE